MNIKKIIKESLDDWSWTQFEPVEPRKENEVRVGDIYTIYNPYGRDEDNIRYVLEIVEIDDYDSMRDDDDEYDGSGTIHYKLHKTVDEEDEPVGSIRTVTKNHAKRLIVQDKYWVLTDSFDKTLTGMLWS